MRTSHIDKRRKKDTPLSLQGRAAGWTCPSHTHRDRTATFVRNIIIPSWIKSPCKLLERRSSQHWRRWRWPAESWRLSRPAPCWSCRTTPGRVRWWWKSTRGTPDKKGWLQPFSQIRFNTFNRKIEKEMAKSSFCPQKCSFVLGDPLSLYLLRGVKAMTRQKFYRI